MKYLIKLFCILSTASIFINSALAEEKDIVQAKAMSPEYIKLQAEKAEKAKKDALREAEAKAKKDSAVSLKNTI